MSYQLVPNIIFIFAVLGILLLILRRLPEAVARQNEESSLEEKLFSKGLPAVAISKINSFAKLWAKKIWHFILEAKDLRPNALAGYKIKKMWQVKSKQGISININSAPQVEKSEAAYLEVIKKEPKNLSHYDLLAKFYIEKNQLNDAVDIYQYLVNHDPANAEFHSRLASCYYQLEQYANASSHYQKSLSLDSTQPNRYYNLGLSLEAQNNFEDSAKAYKNAAALEPTNIKYQLALAEALIKTGDKQKAAMVFLEANRLDPQNPKIQARLKQFRSKSV